MSGTLKVAVFGRGAIGSVVIDRLLAGAVPGAELIAVIARDGADPEGVDVPYVSAAAGIEVADVVVECASVQAARQVGPDVVRAGKTLVLASIGALADPESRAELTAGPGRLVPTVGAIGGLDALAAHRQAGALRDVSITSLKRATSLIQPWMDADQERQLREATEPVTVYSGTASEVIERFPKSANVAVAVGLTAGKLDDVTVTMVADPNAEATTHRVQATSSAGALDCLVTNDPSPQNPASSAIVPYALLADISRL